MKECKASHFRSDKSGRCVHKKFKVGARCKPRGHSSSKAGHIVMSKKGNRFCKVKAGYKGEGHHHHSKHTPKKPVHCTTKSGKKGLHRSGTKKCYTKGKFHRKLSLADTKKKLVF